jgi:RNA polymerase sigma-70 factor, ECF subfamily
MPAARTDRAAPLRLRATAPRAQQPTGTSGPDSPRVPPGLSPEELAVRAQAGSLEAYSALVDCFQDRLFNFLLRRVRASADAEDLTQEAFIRAWQRISTYRPDWRFSTWLFTIAVRLAVSEGRRSTRRTERLGEAHAALGAADGAKLIGGEERSQIWALVGELLSHDQQTAVWLRYVEDMAITDIARVMGRSQVAVRVMLFRARGILASAISPCGERVADMSLEAGARR